VRWDDGEKEEKEYMYLLCGPSFVMLSVVTGRRRDTVLFLCVDTRVVRKPQCI
jgi:hypothetical protein